MALLVIFSVIAIFSQLPMAQSRRPPERNYTQAMVQMNMELPGVYGRNLDNLTAYIYKRQKDARDFPTYEISNRTNITDATDLTCDNAKLRGSPEYGCPGWFNTERGSMPDFMVAEGGFNDTAWAGFVQGPKIDPTYRVLVTHVNQRTSETVKDNHETIINDYVQFSSRGIDCNASDFVVRLEYCRTDNIVVRICVTEDHQVNTPDGGPQMEDPHGLCTDRVSKFNTGIGKHETRGCFNSNVTLSNGNSGIMNRTGLSSRPFRIVIMVKNGAQASSVVPENIVVIKSISATSPTCPPPTTTSTTTSTSTTISTTTTTTLPTTTSTSTTTTTSTTEPTTTTSTSTTSSTSTSTSTPPTTPSTPPTTPPTPPTTPPTPPTTPPTPPTTPSTPPTTPSTPPTTPPTPPTTASVPPTTVNTTTPATLPPTTSTMPPTTTSTTPIPTTVATATLPPTTVPPTIPPTTTPTITTVPTTTVVPITTPVPTAPPTTTFPPTVPSTPVPTPPPTTTTSTSTTTTAKPYDFCRYDCDFTREGCTCTQLWLLAANGNENSCQSDDKNCWKWDTITGNPNTGIIAGKDGIEDGFMYSDTKTVCTLQLPPLTLPPGVTFSCWGYLSAVWEVGYMADNDVVRKSSTKYDHSNWRHWKKCEDKFRLPAKSDAPVPPYTPNPDPSVHQISFTADNRQGTHPYPNLGVLGLDSFHFVDQDGRRVCRNGKYVEVTDVRCTRCPIDRLSNC